MPKTFLYCMQYKFPARFKFFTLNSLFFKFEISQILKSIYFISIHSSYV